MRSVCSCVDDSDGKVARSARFLHQRGIYLINYERRCGAERTNPTGSFVLQPPWNISIISALSRSGLSDRDLAVRGEQLIASTG